MVRVSESILFFMLLGSRNEQLMIIGSFFFEIGPWNIFLVREENRSIQMFTLTLKCIIQQPFKPKNVIGSVKEQNCIMPFLSKFQTFLLQIKYSQVALFHHCFCLTMPGTPYRDREDIEVYFFTKHQLQGPKLSKKLSLHTKLAYSTHFRTQDPKIVLFKGPIVK